MKRICGISLKAALIASALVVLLALPCAAQSQPAGSQGKAGGVSKKPQTLLETMLKERIAAGYAVIGPIELKSASSSTLVLDIPEDKDAATISLGNRKISVMDDAGNGLSVSSLVAGKAVIICQKKDDVVVYVVNWTKKGTGNAQ